MCLESFKNVSTPALGLMQIKGRKSKKCSAAETQMRLRSLDHRIRNITEADITPNLTERCEPLPPLKIEM